jgi:hypothetical protein
MSDTILSKPSSDVADYLDKARIIDNFQKSLNQSCRFSEPYLHYQFRPFSHELYAEILRQLPDNSAYTELRHGDAIRPDGTSARLVLPFRNDMMKGLTSDQKEFWNHLKSVMCSVEIKEMFLERLEPELFKRFNCPLNEVPAIPKLMLMRDLAQYKINIHHDIEWKTITTQYYLPEDESQRNLGTGIYKRYDDGKFVETHKMDFSPGNAYAFAVSKTSWHGVRPVGEIAKPRNSLMLIYFGREGYDY